MGYPIFHSQYTAAQIEASIGKTPRIKAATRTWEIWDIATSAYVDTGVSIDTELFVDNTLTEAGYAADAKVTGDKIGELKSALNGVTNCLDDIPVSKKVSFSDVVKGRWTSQASSGVVANNKYLTTTTRKTKADFPYTSISTDTGYEFSVLQYSSTGTYEESLASWVTTFQISNMKDKKLYAVNVRKTNSSEFTDYDMHLTGADYEYKRFYDIEERLENIEEKVAHIAKDWYPVGIYHGSNPTTYNGYEYDQSEEGKTFSTTFLKINATTITVSVANSCTAELSLYDADFNYLSYTSGASISQAADTAKYARITVNTASASDVYSVETASSLTYTGLVDEFDVEVHRNITDTLVSGDSATDAEMHQNSKTFSNLIYVLSQAGGGTITLGEGIYCFSEKSSIFLKSNVSIIGSGFSTVLKKKSVSTHGTNPMFTYRHVGESTSNPLENCVFSNFVCDCSEWYVSDSNIANAMKIFQGMFYRNCVFSGIKSIGSPATAFGFDCNQNVIVDSCIFINCGRSWGDYGDSGSNGVGFGTGGWQDELTIVSNNVFEDCGRHAIFFEDHYTKSDSVGRDDWDKGIVVTGNVVKGGKWQGIALHNVSNAVVTGNSVYDCKGAGIYLCKCLTNVVVSGNVCQNCGMTAEYLEEHAEDYAQVTTEVEADQGGILIDINANKNLSNVAIVSKNVKISSNIASDNTGSGITKRSDASRSSYQINGLVMSDNLCESNTEYGVAISGNGLNDSIYVKYNFLLGESPISVGSAYTVGENLFTDEQVS